MISSCQVYQTGDLANMDGLPEESKRLLPSLFAIRDGLYSLEFRRLVQSLTGSGPLSGEQIDLSANAFGHTGHLLCHDDVIGTRKVRIMPPVCHRVTACSTGCLVPDTEVPRTAVGGGCRCTRRCRWRCWWILPYVYSRLIPRLCEWTAWLFFVR